MIDDDHHDLDGTTAMMVYNTRKSTHTHAYLYVYIYVYTYTYVYA
jgi:hypothetical protein